MELLPCVTNPDDHKKNGATAEREARKETSASMKRHPEQDKVSLPVYLCERVGVSAFYYNGIMSRERPAAAGAGFARI